MENVPASLHIAFGITTLLTVGIFCRAAHNSRLTLGLLLLWLLLQGLVARSGFYTVTNTVPPHLLGLVAVPLLVIALLFLTKPGRRYLDGLQLEVLTLLHIIRIPVELVLLGLYLHRAVPELMTFAGRNWDVFSGLSAPVIYYLVFRKDVLNTKWLLAWNFLCLGLLINIVVQAMLSAPSVFQRFAFAQPNVAILHFPFNWLPAAVVPLVLLAHLAAIRQLITKK